VRRAAACVRSAHQRTDVAACARAAWCEVNAARRRVAVGVAERCGGRLMRAPSLSTIIAAGGCVGSRAVSKSIAIAVGCSLAALVAASGTAFAQAGSTGGTLGKTDKSASGGEDQPQARQKPNGKPRHSAIGETAAPVSISGKWTWTSKCDDGSEWVGVFEFSQSPDGEVSGTSAGTDAGRSMSGQRVGNKVTVSRTYYLLSNQIIFTIAAGGNSMQGSEISKGHGTCRYQAKRSAP